MRPCFTFKAQAADKPAVLALDDEIGFWGTQAKDFRAQLDAIANSELHVEINSPGGDVFAGLGMYNMLRTWAAAEGRSLTTRVTGVAASIASVVMLAGDKREMPKNAFAMVHQASGIAWGTADDMRDAAGTLDKIDGSIKGIYVDRMGISAEKAAEIMSKDTWLIADECKDLGFATDLTDAVVATAKFDMARADLPEQVQAVFKAKAAPAPTKDTPPAALVDQIIAKAKAAGLEAHAQTIALACTTMVEAEARIASASEIVALCSLAGQPKAAAAAIKKATTVADVRAALVKALADADTDIDNTPPPKKEGATSGASTSFSPTAAWASHNSQKRTNKEGR